MKIWKKINVERQFQKKVSRTSICKTNVKNNNLQKNVLNGNLQKGLSRTTIRKTDDRDDKLQNLRDTARAPQPPTNPSTGHQMSRQGLAQNDQKCQFQAKFGGFGEKS